MNKETFEGLCGIINEMISVRQKVQEELSRRIRDYNMEAQELTHAKLQMRTNTDKITYYTKMKVELRKLYQKEEGESHGN